MYRVSSFISIWAASKFTGFSSTGLESITIGKHIEHRIFKVAFFFGGKRKTTTYNIQEAFIKFFGGKRQTTTYNIQEAFIKCLQCVHLETKTNETLSFLSRHSWSHPSWQIGGKSRSSNGFFLDSKITAVTAAMKLKDACSLEGKL